MEKTYLPLLIVLAVPFFWYALVSGILYLMSFTGWRSLAEKYEYRGDVPKPDFSWASVQTSLLGRYNNCMNVSVTARGIIIRPAWLFRTAHPALLLPWHIMKPPASRSVFGFKYAELEFSEGAGSMRIFAPIRILEHSLFPRS